MKKLGNTLRIIGWCCIAHDLKYGHYGFVFIGSLCILVGEVLNLISKK